MQITATLLATGSLFSGPVAAADGGVGADAAGPSESLGPGGPSESEGRRERAGTPATPPPGMAVATDTVTFFVLRAGSRAEDAYDRVRSEGGGGGRR